MTRRIFHLVDRHEESDQRTLNRKMTCWASWDTMYETGALIPCHCWSYPRNAKSIGDERALPYFRDLLLFGMGQCSDEDIILWTNDDNLILPDLPNYLLYHIAVHQGPCSIFRTEFRSVPSLKLSAYDFGNHSTEKHIGRDGFAFQKKWLVEHWDEIPDVILAASDWDIQMACIIRNFYGITSVNANLSAQILPAEIPNGYTGHIAHHSAWNTANVDTVPSNVHNRALFREYASKHCPMLIFNANNTLK